MIRKSISRLSLKAALLFAVALATMVGAVAVLAAVIPSEVTGELPPGGSMTVDKTVTTPEIPANPDIYFLADTTSSMGPVLAQVRTDIGSILSTLSGAQPTAQFGAGQYKDFPYDAFAFKHEAAIGPDDGPGGAYDASDAVGGWTHGGGYDGSEAQLYALTKIATIPAIGWRGGTNKVLVWFGDAPGHDPVCAAISSEGADITEATATAALVAAGIKVVAISTPSGTYYPAALDDDPTKSANDYVTACSTIGGTSGQATRIADATGGVHLTGVAPADIAQAILDGIAAITTDVWWNVVDDPGLTVTLSPTVHYGVSGGSTVGFTETITVDNNPGLQGQTLTATVTFIANEYPDEGAEFGTQTISIYVPDTTPPVLSLPPDEINEADGPDGTVHDYSGDISATDNVDLSPVITCDEPAGWLFPIGATTVECTATDASGNSTTGTFTKTVVDTTPPEVSCVETVNPHGNNVPKAGQKSPGQNEDGFYQLLATDNIDPDEAIEIFVNVDFGPFSSGDRVKITEAPGVTPTSKKIGSSNGKADAISAHLMLNSDAVVVAVDSSGNESDPVSCLVPPPPK